MTKLGILDNLYIMKIQILSDELASQIAAGEVVERPASVVKELIENSLDASANSIEVNIKEAGKKLIEVHDDGLGIPEDQLQIALSRFATSKLHTAKDLFNINTLGFRGEALASIASVSRFSITSKDSGSINASRLIVDGGKNGEVENVAAPGGTVIRVEDLFFSVPARLKFMKTDNTEKRHINEFVSRYAIAYPDVRWKLTQDKKTIIQSSGNGDRRENLKFIFEKKIAQEMLEVDIQYDDIEISGFISPTSATRSNRRGITFFINGRWVQDSSLAAAFSRAYQSLIMVGRYPFGIIFVKMPPQSIDVNVHPAKAEVRFKDQSKVFSAVQRAVKRTLMAYSPVPHMNIQKLWNQAESSSFESQNSISFGNSGLDENTKTTDVGQSQQELGGRIEKIPLLRLIGQIGSTYIVAEGPDGLYLVDQHAAHERILFEKFIDQAKTKVPTQKLLIPETVTLPENDSKTLEGNFEKISKLGFDIEEFGPNTFRIKGLPAILSGSEPQTELRIVLDEIEENQEPHKEMKIERIIARICKRAAVKGGKVLSGEEQKALLNDLEKCENPRSCPHGRPTMIHLSIDLLEKQFGRTGAL